MSKPNCYNCKHRGPVAGSAHSCCNHPLATRDNDDPLLSIMSIFASVGRTDPIVGDSIRALNIRANLHGVNKGWFNWPWNFDPTWLENCDGFEAFDK